MTPEELMKKYPTVFPRKPYCGVSYSPGWSCMLDKLCGVIAWHLGYSKNEKLKENFAVDQIKCKFGSLRFYVSCQDEFISGAIRMAEHESGNLCQHCGKPGCKTGNWGDTSCGDCGIILKPVEDDED